ncbi:type II secretion system minor pseudopilin GspK, partial [Psychrobacter sp. T6-1]
MQTLTDLRTQQVMGSIDELWQLPALVSVTDEQRQALTPLLSVDSRAFSGLVTASDSDGKQRFAIILIKNALDEGNTTNNESGAASSNLNNQNTSGNNVNSGANDVNGSANNAAASSSESSADKTVKVINRRLYAFRPSF